MQLNKNKYAILGVMSLGPQSGYDVKKLLETMAQNFWRASYGQIYPQLKELAAQGLIRQASLPAEGRPGKQVFALTDEGRRALGEWLASPVEEQPWRIEILLRLFFGRQAPLAENLKRVEEYRRYKEEELLRLAMTERGLREECAGQPDLPYFLLTVDYGRMVMKACLEWCEHARRTLENLDADSNAAAPQGAGGEKKP